MSAIFELRRLGIPLLFIIMLAGAAFTYNAKHHAVEAADQVSDLRRQIEQERMRLSLLKAEWGELTQPGRIQGLVDQYPEVLALQPFGIDRMVRITDIPFAPDHDFIADMLATAPATTVQR
ncbi:MAG: hypothetical protein AB7O56_00780 [Bauldia sp.]